MSIKFQEMFGIKDMENCTSHQNEKSYIVSLTQAHLYKVDNISTCCSKFLGQVSNQGSIQLPRHQFCPPQECFGLHPFSDKETLCLGIEMHPYVIENDR